jgi:hypothetical protein
VRMCVRESSYLCEQSVTQQFNTNSKSELKDRVKSCSTMSRICKPFKEPRNRFPAWRAVMTTLFVIPARQATQAGRTDSSESILGSLNVYKKGLWFGWNLPPHATN